MASRTGDTEQRVKTQLMRQLNDASAKVYSTADRIKTEMSEMQRHIEGGFHTQSLNHQLPFDLATALAKRQAAIEGLMRYNMDPNDETFVLASKGELI